MSPRPQISDGDFIKLWEELGPAKMARKLGRGERGLFRHRERIESRTGKQVTGPEHQSSTRNGVSYDHRVCIEVQNGIVLVGSDAHYWPGEISTAHRAFVRFCKELKPAAVIMNGDVLDASTASRHPPIGWEHRPKLKDEIATCKERLGEIEQAAGRAIRIWPIGNHDARFSTRLATVAPEYAEIHGVRLQDHFPLWQPCWSAWINDSVVVKHRFRSGIHAPHNNALWAGKTIITGHLHSAKVVPLTDYRETRYGVDTGCLADVDAKAFVDYSEDSPKNWRSAFCVLTFINGELLMPELVMRWSPTEVQFRGQIIKV